MKTVYKYELGPLGITTDVVLPAFASVLSAGIQEDNIFIWVLVDDEEYPVTRQFVTYGTGWEIYEDDVSHIDTIFHGPFVWHVFEVL